MVQHTESKSDEPYPPGSAVIVTDLCRFLFNTDQNTVQSWINDRRRHRPDGLYNRESSVGWMPNPVWDDLVQSTRSTSPRFLIVPMVSVQDAKGSERETDTMWTYMRNVETMLGEVAYQSDVRRYGSQATRAQDLRSVFPNLRAFIMPRGKTLSMSTGGSIPKLLKTGEPWRSNHRDPRTELEDCLNGNALRLGGYEGDGRVRVCLRTSHDPCATQPSDTANR